MNFCGDMSIGKLVDSEHESVEDGSELGRLAHLGDSGGCSRVLFGVDRWMYDA